MGAAGMRPVRQKPAYEPAPVQLHIYDIGVSNEVWVANNMLRAIGAGGAFHCGVEVYGTEWSYEMGTGIVSCRPRCCEEHSYRESLVMGKTSLSEGDVLDVVDCLREEWPGSDYDVLRRNCCHLSDEMCRRLGVGSVPDWVSELASSIASAEVVVADVVHTKGCCSVVQGHQDSPSISLEDATCGSDGLWCSGFPRSPCSDPPVVKTLVCRGAREVEDDPAWRQADRTPRISEEVIPRSALSKVPRRASGAPGVPVVGIPNFSIRFGAGEELPPGYPSYLRGAGGRGGKLEDPMFGTMATI
mmetsp:Transcript_51921/g.153060  ORF Transcript_51921/g.153060 Transcript_51921/m.153060 type:complete len:301 (-) Transcript_51921:76-978(-)